MLCYDDRLILYDDFHCLSIIFVQPNPIMFPFAPSLPPRSIGELKQLVVGDSHFEALIMIENYTKCFPYMETSTLIFLLADSWEIFAKRAQCVVSKAISAIAKVVADGNKAAEGAEEKANAHKASCEAAKARVNIKLYKMRALRKVWDEKVNGGEKKEGEEKEGQGEAAAAEVAA